MGAVIDLQERRHRKYRDQFRMSTVEQVVLLLLEGYSTKHIAFTLGKPLDFIIGIEDRLNRGIFDDYLKRTGKR